MPAVITFVRTALKHWQAGLIGLLLLAAAVQTVRLGHRGNQLERAKINLNECRQGRVDDRNAYAEAQRQAAEKNRAQVARIEAEQQKVTDDVEANLHARLERLRSELRSKAAPRNPNGPQASPDGKAAPGTPQEAEVCLAPSDVLRAAENEERHDQLITWVEEQLKVAR